MEKQVLDDYIKAGRIAAQARDEGAAKVVAGARLIDVAEWIEGRISALGGGMAFPVNISINNVAAHYTPDREDASVFAENDVVKLDIGVHVNGYIGDTACTISLAKDGRYDSLLKASREALEDAVKIAVPGTRLGEIGEAVENRIHSYGFKPVANLTGHGLEQYNLHAEPQVPSIKNGSGYVLEDDQVIAIEPFASTGDGFVKESGEVLIYMLLQPQPVRMPEARQIINYGMKTNGLPFAKRWLAMSDIKFRLAMRELRSRNAVHEYPVLRDADGCRISQFEHTVIVGEKPMITTLPV